MPVCVFVPHGQLPWYMNTDTCSYRSPLKKQRCRLVDVKYACAGELVQRLSVLLTDFTLDGRPSLELHTPYYYMGSFKYPVMHRNESNRQLMVVEGLKGFSVERRNPKH
jgi:hypothetical protein